MASRRNGIKQVRREKFEVKSGFKGFRTFSGFSAFALALALVAGHASAVGAQALTQRNMSLEIARALADASIACAKRNNYDVTVAVVDRAGDLVLLMRGNRANPHNAENAQRKAYTARTFGESTMQFRNRTNDNEMEGLRELSEVIELGGGAPVTIGNERIGGLGLSGAPTQEADDICAAEALKSAVAMLK